MNVDVETIWQSMSEEPPPPSGGVLTRLIPVPHYNVHLTQARPSGLLGFRASSAEAPGAAWRGLRSSRGLDVSVDARPDTPSALNLVEREASFHEVFRALVMDLLQSLETLAAVPEAARPLMLDVLAERVLRWQRCLSAVEDGLGDELQAGLFGELLVLESLLTHGVNALQACEAWTGPDRLSQDYQLPGLSIEVKTTRTLQPERLRISSERQLDTSSGMTLFLIHVSLDERMDGRGRTLPELVQSIRQTLRSSSPLGRLIFDDRLLDYGYLDLHAERYSKRSYFVRDLSHYHVQGHFPRIVEADLPPGVGAVTYDLVIASCEPFRVAGRSFVQALARGGE